MLVDNLRRAHIHNIAFLLAALAFRLSRDTPSLCGQVVYSPKIRGIESGGHFAFGRFHQGIPRLVVLWSPHQGLGISMSLLFAFVAGFPVAHRFR